MTWRSPVTAKLTGVGRADAPMYMRAPSSTLMFVLLIVWFATLVTLCAGRSAKANRCLAAAMISVLSCADRPAVAPVTEAGGLMASDGTDVGGL